MGAGCAAACVARARPSLRSLARFGLFCMRPPRALAPALCRAARRRSVCLCVKRQRGSSGREEEGQEGRERPQESDCRRPSERGSTAPPAT